MLRSLCILATLCFIACFVVTPQANAGFYANLTSPTTQNINQGYLYGERSSSGVTHMGIDFRNNLNDPIYAAAAGTVHISTDLATSYGKYIVLKHSDATRGTYYTLYAHLNQRLVEAGEKVSAGEQIGLAGQTGNATGVHLHFEIRHNSDFTVYEQGVRNPECWLQRSNYNGYGSVYAMAKTSSGSRIEQMRISGATKPESGYGASYTYARTNQNNYELGDITAYGINYHIARANPASIQLKYEKTGYTTKYQSVTIEANKSKRINDMAW